MSKAQLETLVEKIENVETIEMCAAYPMLTHN
jgi:hypothetical protein